MTTPKTEEERAVALLAANRTAFLMLACTRAGMSLSNIARRFNVTRQSIYRDVRPALQAHGFDFDRAPRKPLVPRVPGLRRGRPLGSKNKPKAAG